MTEENVDNLELFKTLLQKPKVAWPTIFLLVAAFAIFAYSPCPLVNQFGSVDS